MNGFYNKVYNYFVVLIKIRLSNRCKMLNMKEWNNYSQKCSCVFPVPIDIIVEMTFILQNYYRIYL